MRSPDPVANCHGLLAAVYLPSSGFTTIVKHHRQGPPGDRRVYDPGLLARAAGMRAGPSVST